MNRRILTLLVAVVPIVAFGLLLSLATVPYVSLGPGPTFNTIGEYDGKKVVDIKGGDVHPTTGHLDMTTVSQRDPLTLGQALTLWMSGREQLVPRDLVYPPDKSKDEIDQANNTEFKNSEDSAEYAALGYLKYPSAVTVATVNDPGPSVGKLQPGDAIDAVDGVPVTSLRQFTGIMEKTMPDQEITLDFRRKNAPAAPAPPAPAPLSVASLAAANSLANPDLILVGQILKIGGQPDYTVNAGDTLTKIVAALTPPPAVTNVKLRSNIKLRSSPDKPHGFLGVGVVEAPWAPFSIDFNLANIGGPSAGLMFSLAVVDKLTTGDLNDGKFVAGTGTIDSEGKVGSIGGITHKILAAREKGASVFLVPADNCDEAKTADEDGLQLVKVDSLGQAVDALHAISAGGEPPRC